jgi:hypothetical protein
MRMACHWAVAVAADGELHGAILCHKVFNRNGGVAALAYNGPREARTVSRGTI